MVWFGLPLPNRRLVLAAAFWFVFRFAPLATLFGKLGGFSAWFPLLSKTWVRFGLAGFGAYLMLWRQLLAFVAVFSGICLGLAFWVGLGLCVFVLAASACKSGLVVPVLALGFAFRVGR